MSVTTGQISEIFQGGGGEGLEYLEKEDDHKNPARGYMDKDIFAMQSRKRLDKDIFAMQSRKRWTTIFL